MSQSTHTPTEVSPTQLLRNLIEDAACGMALPEELHDALTLLEQALHLAPTSPHLEREEVAA
ncbi:hypothetical protein GU243_06080 [Pseudarthrobacter psychrotolerans]|uniref:Uncharacterized protein n=1 Tax=Pseudarthrobacter psychrotolerans TaxID=2697569 RepID=A0A6P1NLN0_9MICC|nr:hypothetical protein [Pseudarthrobacter psychrotolerans]QHK19380.1 hypothetical protein GU243_06080 [Pseudarthrobacter psychrotolerans]